MDAIKLGCTTKFLKNSKDSIGLADLARGPRKRNHGIVEMGEEKGVVKADQAQGGWTKAGIVEARGRAYLG